MRGSWFAVALLLLTGLLVTACGADPADTEWQNDVDVDEPDEPEGADEGSGETDRVAKQSLTGTLEGDAQLEGGCVWLETPDGRYEVLWPDDIKAETDPVQLVRDGEVVAEEGDEVVVEGHVEDDMVSVCQVGTIFTAERLVE